MATEIPVHGRRSYRSPRRQQQAEQTRGAVLAAATRRFAAGGWAGTGMRDVAGLAGVSVETVYATFGSKAGLLTAALDAAVTGDTLSVPLAERPEFAVLAQGGLAERAAAAASLLAQVHERSAGLQVALCEAAPGEPRLAEQLRANEERRHEDVARGAALVAGRPVTAAECDGLWAITSADVYRSLTSLRGWTVERYRDWLAGVLVRLLTPGADEPEPSNHGPGSHGPDPVSTTGGA